MFLSGIIDILALMYDRKEVILMKQIMELTQIFSFHWPHLLIIDFFQVKKERSASLSVSKSINTFNYHFNKNHYLYTKSYNKTSDIVIVFLFVGILILSLLLFLNIKPKKDEKKNYIRRYDCIIDILKASLFEYDYLNDELTFEKNMITSNQCSSKLIFHFSQSGRYKNIWNMLELKEDYSGRILIEKDLSLKWYNIDIKIIRDEYNNALYAVGALEDVDELVKKHQFLEYQANHDCMTNLLNRQGLNKEIEEVLRNDSSGVIMLFDIDNFKKVNDTLGHPFGDALLREFGSYINNYFHNHIVSRFAGDEFIVILTGKYDQINIKELLEDLMIKLYNDIFIDYDDLKVSCSIGALIFTGNVTFTKLYNQVDKLLYYAKDDESRSFVINTYQDNNVVNILLNKR